MIDFLRKLGLNKYEAQAYMALIRGGPSSAFMISKDSSVPFGRIYDSLNNLEQKGFVEVVPSKPKKYKAVNPETALNGLIDDELNNLEKMRESIKDQVQNIKKQSKSDGVISVNSGKSNFAKHIAEHFNYKNEYWATSGSFAIEKWYPALQRHFLGRDPSDRHIFTNKNNSDPKHLEELKKLKLNIKNYPLEDVRFVVSDNELVTISIQEEGKEWTNIHVKSKPLGKALTKIFKTIWDNAEDI